MRRVLSAFGLALVIMFVSFAPAGYCAALYALSLVPEAQASDAPDSSEHFAHVGHERPNHQALAHH